MNSKFPFAAVVVVLGLCGCIVLLAHLASCGGEGSEHVVDNAITFAAPINVAVTAGSTITVAVPAP